MDSRGQYDEFDLRNYIHVIFKRRNLLLMIFFCTVTGTAIVNFFRPEVYEASALVLVSPLANQKFVISLGTHVALMESGIVLDRTIKKLDLTDRNGKPLLTDDLLGKIAIKQEEKTNIFRFSARDKDPLMAVNLANVWAREYIQYSQEFASGEIKGMDDLDVNRSLIVKRNLAEAQQKVADFRDHYKIDIVQAELSMEKEKLNTLKEDLLNAQINRSKTGHLQEDIASLQKNIYEVAGTLNQKQIEFEQLTLELSIYKKAYYDLFLNVEETPMSKVAALEEVNLVSAAYQPRWPVSLHKRKNIMQVGIISLMAGLFLVFFMEWFGKKSY